MTPRSQSFGYRFAMLYRLNASLCREEIKEIGLSMGQVPFIAELLFEEGPLTQAQLSQRLEIDKAATARGLDILDRRGWVERTVNPHNRRQKLVYATDKAKKIADRFFSALAKTNDLFIEGFTEDETKNALDLLDRMMINARKMKYGESYPESKKR